MRNFPWYIKQIISNDIVKAVYLIKIRMPQVSLLVTSASYDIEIPEIGTFIADSSIKMLDMPRLSDAVDKATYKIEFSDPLFEKRPLFEAGIIGAEATVYLAFYNTLGTRVNDTDPDFLFTDAGSLLIAYSGTVDTIGYIINPDDGEATASLSCASPMAAMALSKPYFTAKDSLKKIDSTDTAFDQISSSKASLSFVWGKL